MVTGTPSAETMVAYSTPIAPPPTISSSRGLWPIPAMVSESNTHRPSKGTLAGRSGLDPVAMMTRPARSRVCVPSAARARTVCSPSSRASPRTRCTPRSRIRSSVACRSCSLPAGKVKIGIETNHPDFMPRGPLNVTMTVNGEPVAKGTAPVTCPIAFSANDCLDIGVALGSPVSPDYYDKAPFRFTGTIERVHVACVIPK